MSTSAYGRFVVGAGALGDGCSCVFGTGGCVLSTGGVHATSPHGPALGGVGAHGTRPHGPSAATVENPDPRSDGTDAAATPDATTTGAGVRGFWPHAETITDTPNTTPRIPTFMAD